MYSIFGEFFIFIHAENFQHFVHSAREKHIGVLIKIEFLNHCIVFIFLKSSSDLLDVQNSGLNL